MAVLENLVTTDYLQLGYTNSVDLFANYTNKTETDNLLANKVSTTGDVYLSRYLDIGTAYHESRLRCNAFTDGFTGYAELRAPTSYDLFLNPETTRPNGG